MKDLVGMYAENTLTEREGVAKSHPIRDAWNVAKQGAYGIGYGIGVAGSKVSLLASATVAEAVSFGYFDSDPIFAQVDSVQDYWGKDAGAKTTAQGVAFGVAKSLSQFGLFGWAGAGTTSAIDRTVSEMSAGKTLGQAGALGALEGITNAAGALIPARAALIGPAAWRSGAGMAAQRVGYGVASNVVPGMAQRYAEGTMLKSWGYGKEAEGVKALDGTAIAIDAIFGVAVGGYSAYASGKATAEIEAEITQTRAALEEQRTTAAPDQVKVIDEKISALGKMSESNSSDMKAAELRQKAESDVDAFISREDADPAIVAAIDAADDLPTKLRLIGDDAGAAALDGSTARIDPDVVDSAMVENQRIVGIESATEGRAMNDAEAAKIDTSLHQIARAMDTGERVEIPEIKTVRNPDKEAAHVARESELRTMGGEDAPEIVTREVDWSVKPVDQSVEAKAVKDALSQHVETLGDGRTFDVEMDDGSIKTLSKEEFLKRFDDEMSYIDNEEQAMNLLAACVLG